MFPLRFFFRLYMDYSNVTTYQEENNISKLAFPSSETADGQLRVMDKFRHIFRNDTTKGLKLKSKTIRDLGLHVHCNMINVTDNYFPNLNTVSMKEVTLTVLTLTIRLKAVEITPAE